MGRAFAEAGVDPTWDFEEHLMECRLYKKCVDATEFTTVLLKMVYLSFANRI